MLEFLLNPAAFSEEIFDLPEDGIWQYMIDYFEKQELSDFPKVISKNDRR